MARLISIFHKIEDAVLVCLLLVMISMAVGQIVLRNVFDSGIIWADPLVRVLVLWLGLIGAMAASRTGNHISIDVISRYLPEPIKRFTSLFVYLFTAFVSGLMTWHSIRFVSMEKADGLIAFGSVPAWVCEIIIPIAFGIITIRYILFFLDQILKIARPTQ